jgi:hypothetical protein
MDRIAMKSSINILVVTFCIGNLAFHFVEQSISNANILGSYELTTTDGEELQDQPDLSEDCVVLSHGNSITSWNLSKSIFLTAALYPALPVFLPHIPPPKLLTIA